MKIVIRIGIVVVLLAAIAAGLGYYSVYWPNVRVKDDGLIYIREVDSFDTVLAALQNKGYIENAYTLRKVAELKKYPQNIKSGCYQIKDGSNNNDLVNQLRSGTQYAVHFTFNNIRTMEQFAKIVSEQLDMDSLEILKYTRDTELIEKMGFTGDNFIGMFIPNTYQVYWNTDVDDFMERMHDEYRKFWNEPRREKAEKAGLSPMDVMILASIIEEETVRPEEYPVIAGVYINRLQRDIPLSACPTIKFALNDFSLKRILNEHTQVESPYNTYKYKGLPPGPVRMPSINVIEAVLNYQKHDYLYFCAKSDFSGGHNFSRTLQQHNAYARQYHEALNKRRIF